VELTLDIERERCFNYLASGDTRICVCPASLRLLLRPPDYERFMARNRVRVRVRIRLEKAKMHAKGTFDAANGVVVAEDSNRQFVRLVPVLGASKREFGLTAVKAPWACEYVMGGRRVVVLRKYMVPGFGGGVAVLRWTAEKFARVDEWFYTIRRLECSFLQGSSTASKARSRPRRAARARWSPTSQTGP